MTGRRRAAQASAGSVRRPTPVDPDVLVPYPGPFDGAWNAESVLVTGAGGVGADGSGDLLGSVVTGADLSGSRFSPLTLVDSSLRKADLSNAVWQQVVARRVELLGCRATGLRLSVDLADDLYVEDSRLDYATIWIERVKGVAVFSGCTFRNATISGDLSRVVFAGCDFDGAEFVASSAAGCDLRTSALGGARGLLTLRGARVTPDQTISIALRLAAEVGLRIDTDEDPPPA